jgi:hypothetical protein
MDLLKCHILVIIVVFLSKSPVDCADWSEKGRFRLLPELSLKESYSDNIFKSPDEKQTEFITIVSPQVFFDIALAPKNYFSLHYAGDFEFHSEYDNFKTSGNLVEIAWDWLTPKGSSFKAGANIKDTASQPYSEGDRSKDYLLYRLFAYTTLKLGAITDLGFKYEYNARRYDTDIDRIDDYDRYTAAINLVYSYFTQIPLLIEYRFQDQQNQEFAMHSRDSTTHSVYLGARWQAAPRLNGTLRFGYYRTDFDADEFKDNSGFSTDSDLTYLFSEITTLRLTAFRNQISATLAERETGNSYVSEGGSFSIKHHYWEPIILKLEFHYTRNDYQDTNRLDHFYRFGNRVQYLFRNWLSLSLVYWYSDRHSNFAPVEYDENEIQAVVTLSP